MKRKPLPAFSPPNDVKTYWLAPHCGPGNLDPEEICGFCGEPQGVCAQKNSVALEMTKREQCGVEQPESCGGSGFWCADCGRFWANDSCGERFGADYAAADGAALEYRENEDMVYCVCGHQLFRPGSEEV